MPKKSGVIERLVFNAASSGKGGFVGVGYECGKFPVAEYLAAHVVNLPTTPSDVGRVIEFLEGNLDEIVDS